MMEAVRRFRELHPPKSDRGDDEDDAQRQILHRNIRALLDLRVRYAEGRAVDERVADRITAFAGSMPFVYLHLVLFGAWLVVNSGVVPFIEPFDPFPFVMLAMWASVEAIFLSTFVLISQNRQADIAQKRDDLDLQINLLAEHEITQVLSLVDEIAKRLDVPRAEKITEPLKRDVEPGQVLREIERVEAGDRR